MIANLLVVLLRSPADLSFTDVFGWAFEYLFDRQFKSVRLIARHHSATSTSSRSRLSILDYHTLHHNHNLPPPKMHLQCCTCHAAEPQGHTRYAIQLPQTCIIRTRHDPVSDKTSLWSKPSSGFPVVSCRFTRGSCFWFLTVCKCLPT
jgi:hypothetical protein